MKVEIIEIEWIDSKGITATWEYKDEIKPLEPCLVKSIGYLLEDEKSYKTLVQSMSEDQLLGRLTIPKVSIKKIRRLK